MSKQGLRHYSESSTHVTSLKTRLVEWILDDFSLRLSRPQAEIFMKIPKLDRQHEYEINAHQSDHLCLWDSPFHEDRQNLTLEDGNGNKILSIYAITREQLSILHSEIATVLKRHGME